MSNTSAASRIPAIKVHQWLNEWNKIRWNDDENRRKPSKEFYQFSIRASHLRALSGVYRRSTSRDSAASDLGIQRRHEARRSREIGRFIRYGFPWSNLSEAKRNSRDFNDLRQPGWLPTAIIVNILTPEDERNNNHVDESDLITVRENKDSIVHICLPENFSGKKWKHKEVPPIEIIDGQHRLWAFDDESLSDDFEVPVVAFWGLDLSWQAYLFYTINIKPKKINASLAYDLYPLLRTESWLTKSEGHKVYQETRAQELVDLLWSYPKSPWHHRINMLGETGKTGLMVTQAAWIRSLMSSFTKRGEGRRVQIGGLYGSKMNDGTILSWDFHQQAAFLILAGSKLEEAIKKSKEDWAQALRKMHDSEYGDPAFYGKDNLLNQDQGVRILLQVINDMVFVCHESNRIDLASVFEDIYPDYETDSESISHAIKILKHQTELADYLDGLCECLAAYDWRAANALNPNDPQHMEKLTFRGSGGYKSFRMNILQHLRNGEHPICEDADEVFERLGYA